MATMDFMDSSDDDSNETTLKINETYAKKFNERKRKEELRRNKDLVSKVGLEGNLEEDSSSDDDSDAELLTEKVDEKLIKTLEMIRRKDPSIYEMKEPVFEDADFKRKKKQKAASKVTYGDLLRDTLEKEGAEAFTKAEEEQENVSKNNDENTAASAVDAIKQLTLEDDSGDELFESKVSAKRSEEEENSYKEFVKGQVDAAESKKDGTVDMLARFFGDPSKLDDTDKFLRDYLMNKKWLDRISSLQGQRKEADRGEEDEDSDEDAEEEARMNDFERQYNFRFEEPTAPGEKPGEIQGHARGVISSVRKDKNEEKKKRRAEREARKTEEKKKRMEELQRLKELKKQELRSRLQQIETITGHLVGGEDSLKLLDGDWDPSAYDQEMDQILGDDYYQQDADAALDEGELRGAALEGEEMQTSLPPQLRELSLGGQGEGEEEGEESEVGEWWLCDGCQKPILPGSRRFDCKECADFTLCQPCYKAKKHDSTHLKSMVKLKVPAATKVPKQWDMSAKAPVKSSEEGSNAAPEGVQEELSVEGALAEKKRLLEQYFSLDYEDLIGGEIPTRFKYTSVAPNSYSLSAEQILEMADKELNQVVGLKKLAPYREQTTNPLDSGKKWEVRSTQVKRKNWNEDAKERLKRMAPDRLEAFGLKKAAKSVKFAKKKVKPSKPSF